MKLTFEVPDTTVAITVSVMWASGDGYYLAPYCFDAKLIKDAANGETLIATPRPKTEEDE